MFELGVRNVNEALPSGAALLLGHGVKRPSRYGDVIELDEPVTTHYDRPLERVLFSPKRDANPFLHLFESLWILAGRQDVGPLTRFAKRMAEFSDNGKTFHAAYGHRLRSHFVRVQDVETGIGMMTEHQSVDQLALAIQMLKEDPMSRRVVCSIWDPRADLGINSKDIPCNDMIKFEARSGQLNMVVFNRSNDLVWGTYGANAVQFAFILEYVAAMAGLPVGWYEQVSCNYHAYEATVQQAVGDDYRDPYHHEDYEVYPLVTNPDTFDHELRTFLHWCDLYELQPSTPEYLNSFFPHVAIPMFQAHRAYKLGHAGAGADFVRVNCKAPDWRDAAASWLLRRAK